MEEDARKEELEEEKGAGKIHEQNNTHTQRERTVRGRHVVQNVRPRTLFVFVKKKTTYFNCTSLVNSSLFFIKKNPI